MKSFLFGLEDGNKLVITPKAYQWLFANMCKAMRGENIKVKKNKLLITILLIASLLMISGCKKFENVDNPKNLTNSPSMASGVTEAPTVTNTIEPSTTIKPTLNPEEQSMEAYKKFMKNEIKVSFDRFMPKYDMGEALYKKGSEYTLSEVLGIVTAYYFKYSTNKKIKNIDYSYIDCGKDGVSELVLRLNGMDKYDKDDDSTLVYILKYIDGKLSLCYYYETWARSETTMNEYGYCQSGGSNGASNHIIEYSLIDKDGKWQPIVSIESETDIGQLTLSDKIGQIPKVAETKGITGGIELDTICFDNKENVANSDEVGNKECFYTFYIYDDNMNPIKDANLYTNSIYKKIFDEAKVPFITPDEVSTMISKKDKKLGATDEIKKGKEIKWKTLSGNMFSEYVGR